MDNAPLGQFETSTPLNQIEDEQASDNAFTLLKSWRAKNRERLTIGSLNINSISNKIDDSRTLISWTF